MTDVRIRKAHMGDVKGIHALLMGCAAKGLLLPRALSHLYRHVRDFYVAEMPDGRLVACCALAPTWEDLAEICSLVVDESLRRLGLGRRIVETCIRDCRELGPTKVFALTYQEEFFRHLGFSVVDKDVLPQKIWADCVHCPKYPDCDETAVLLEL
ncbi:MAG: N-acetyltransferase [Desulfovibrionaceae bacterium]|nr:N-acetyltransferase [Desulfovibrionaceae bacterium]